jgi:hypothetical protein
MKKNLLIVGIVFLFIGMGFQPAFANNIQFKENKPSIEESYEEIIISFYGIGKTDDIKVLLTEEQADKLDMILNELDFNLRNSGSKSQTINSINWAFNSFQEFNLFNKKDEKIIRTFLISLFTNSKVKSDTKPINQEDNKNWDCTITGFLYQKTHRFKGIVQFYEGLGPIFNKIVKFIFSDVIIMLLLFPISIPLILYLAFHSFFGKEYGAYVTVGLHYKAIHEAGYEIHDWIPIKCDIHTNGTNGIITWEGDQYGQIRNIMSRGFDGYSEWWKWLFVGIEYFTGVKFTNIIENKIYISGFANQVALDFPYPPHI